MKMGLRDKIFNKDKETMPNSRGGSQLNSSFERLRAKISVSNKKIGYPNIFSNRSLFPVSPSKVTAPVVAPDPSIEGGKSLLTPKGSMFRQEMYLKKISSEKRNMLSLKRFNNSGFGRDHGHPNFIRKII
uniref:Uncharacterized protein n=1 Tax=Strombidium inclinatum TaxID=197538 RepID=A0A7S3MYR5_9SPIT|mmetsp:Transcript_29829/g.45519  ORF Transcript_29829/g.45519 Transcript_29829/m.45519 type:complete len:130 (+) Transcript_29829:2437-2826(+)